MRATSIIGVVALMVCGSAVLAQVTPEEAAKRLQEKATARAAERSKPATITQGELDDLKAELVRLRAQVAQLQAASSPAQTTPAVKLVPKIAVGISKEELMRFVSLHKTAYAITRDTPEQGTATQKAETVVVQGKAKRRINLGIGSNGVQRVQDYREEMRPDVELTVHLINDRVAAVEEQKLPFAPDELRN